VKHADDNAYGNADVITLTNNAMVYLLRHIRYQLSGQVHVIESLVHPGQAAKMFDLSKYLDDFQKSQGLNQLWYKDSKLTAHLENNAGFGVLRQGFVIQKPNP